jgi:hypothetical protein
MLELVRVSGKAGGVCTAPPAPFVPVIVACVWSLHDVVLVPKESVTELVLMSVQAIVLFTVPCDENWIV